MVRFGRVKQKEESTSEGMVVILDEWEGRNNRQEC